MFEQREEIIFFRNFKSFTGVKKNYDKINNNTVQKSIINCPFHNVFGMY